MTTEIDTVTDSNVNWIDNGERADETVLNRPLIPNKIGLR